MKSYIGIINIRRFISFILSVCMLFSNLYFSFSEHIRVYAQTGSCNAKYEDCFEVYTEGRTSYKVHNAASFNKFISLVNSGLDFEGVTINLVADMNPASVVLHKPVGTKENPFNGTFEGNGYSISNVKFDDSTLVYNGLFGYIGESGIVRGFTVNSSSFIGGEYCGGIAGKCDGIIENCSVNDVSVSATKYAGGIVGYSSCDFTGASSSGTVFATGEGGYAGGIAGWLNGDLFNTYSSCEIIGADETFCGGIAGYLEGTAVNCYASGNVNGGTSSYCGGFAAISNGQIDNAYASGTVTGGTDSVSVGFAADCRANIYNSYWNSTANTIGIGNETSFSLPIGKTMSEFLSLDMVALLNSRALDIIEALGWAEDLESDNGGFPILTANVAGFGGGDGSAKSPYLIVSESHLHLFINLINTKNEEYGSLNYKMTSDIHLDPKTSNNIGYIGIWDGVNYPELWFSGVFDGGGHSIIGINTSRAATDKDDTKVFCLFNALTKDACIKNLNIVDANVKSSFHCGIIAAINYGTIKNCSVSGNAETSFFGSAGGIVSTNYGTIINCISTATVKYMLSGEIVGDNLGDGVVINCFAAGSSESNGAICGNNNSSLKTDALKDNYFLQTDTINTGKYGISVQESFGSSPWHSNIGAEPISKDMMTGKETFGETNLTVLELLNQYALSDSTLLAWTNDEDGYLCFDYPEVEYISKYGSIKSDSLKFAPGSAVNLTPIPDENFAYDSENFNISLVSNGTTIDYIENSDGTISFVMPNSDIIVNAAFRLMGEGTESVPFEIYTAENIKFMSDQINSGINRGACYKLMDNIRYTNEQADEFVPIGTVSSGFTGSFDGNDKAISNLVISRNINDDGYFGFFGYISGGTVSNLNINANISLTSESNISILSVGSIAAYLMSGSINNCSFSGRMAVSGGKFSVNAGGIAGTAYGKIVNCNNSARISSSGNAGGIIGIGGNSIIWNCYNMGNIAESLNGGGIIGYASDDLIENCYSHSSVSGLYTGSIAGYCEDTTVFKFCYYSTTLFDGFGAYGYEDSETGILSMTIEAIKTKAFANELNHNAGNSHIDVSETSLTPSEWMQNSVTGTGCPAFLRQAVNVISNSITNIQYWDVQDAVDEAGGAKLFMLYSVELSYNLINDSEDILDIDLKGKKLTCSISNAGTMNLSNGTAACDITNDGELKLENIIVFDEKGIINRGILTIGGSTQITTLYLDSGFVGVCSELTADFVANLNFPTIIPRYKAVKGVNFTLGNDVVNKFSVEGGYALSFSESDNALLIFSSPSVSITQNIDSVYDGEPIEADVDFTLNTQSEGDVSYSYCKGLVYDDSTAWISGLPVNAGSYVIRAEVMADFENSYANAFGYGNVTVSKRTLTVSAEDKAISFLDSEPSYTANFSGFVGMDTAAIVSGEILYSCDYKIGSPAGEYDIVPNISNLYSDNYIFVSEKGTLTVEKLFFEVMFLDYDLTVIDTQVIEHGNSAVAPEVPARAGHVFLGWDTEIDNITDNLVVNAVYDKMQYTVNFLDYDGTIISSQKVYYESSAEEPDPPQRAGHVFLGWDAEIDNITDNLVVNAVYDKMQYTVNFLDYDGTIISSQKVYYESSAEEPDPPQRTGHVFLGWDAEIDNITDNLVVNAVYDKMQYTVNFLDYDGTIISSQKVYYESSAEEPDPPQRAGYTFSGWSSDFSSITESINIVAVYNINEYTVNFYDYDNTLILTQIVEYGKSAVAPAAPERKGYSFIGWDNDISTISHNLDVTAMYEINIYTVIFADYNGDVLSVQQVEHGSDANPPKNPNREGYNFIDWNRSYKNISADTTITAVYEIIPDKIKHTVSFIDYDGTVLLVCEVEDLSAAPAPDEPYQEGYTFIGWDKDFYSVSEDMMIYAVYEENVPITSFNVIFKDYDGSIISTQVVEYGKSAQEPDSPKRSGYTFIGWDKDFSNIVSYLTVTAQYELIPQVNLFTVTFKDYDGTTLSKETVEYLADATVPDVPARIGYDFIGWDKSYKAITDNITITAQYELKRFLVVFFDYDGSMLDQQYVSYGNTAIYPNEPLREGHTFIDWDTDFSYVTEELSIKAMYEINKYTVTFFNFDATVLDTQTIEYGESATAPNAPFRKNHTFIGWSVDFSYITSSLSVTAQYKIDVFTVVFRDYDGSIISTQEVNYNSSAEAPEVTSPEGYAFAGWDKLFSNVTSDIIVTAQYVLIDSGNVYQITFMGIDETVIAIHYVQEGDSAIAPIAPSVKGYDFTGWDKDFSNIIADMTVTAIYTLSSSDMIYTVVFIDYDKTVISVQSVKSGDNAEAPDTPLRNGYLFEGWSADFTKITADLTVKAQYSAISYTVTFINYDDSIIEEQVVYYGQSALQPEPAIRDGYTFKGWDISFSYITDDIIVRAVYILNITGTHTVTFIGMDGAVLKTEYVMDGDEAVAPRIGEIKGYEFIGWDTSFSNVSSDLTINAIYRPLKFTVIFCDYNGGIISTKQVEYGKSVDAPNPISRLGYTFIGWDKSYSSVTQDIVVTALYRVNIYNVVFLDADGIVLSIQQIEHGSDASAPEVPTIDGMVFVGWDNSYKAVSSNLEITAIYTITNLGNDIVVTFLDHDQTILKILYTSYGSDVLPPEPPQHSGYRFIGWDKGLENITQSTKITALYEKIDSVSYTVMFVDFDGKVLSSQKVNQGMSAVAPALPQRVGYTFSEWSADYSAINSDIIITALYTIKTYWVVFKDYDGTTLSTQIVEHSNPASVPIVDPRIGYRFTGWSLNFSSVTSDLEIYALYEINTYTVTFIGFDGKILKTQKVSYLKDAAAPIPPSVNNYDFVMWDEDFTEVIQDVTVNAVYERSKLLVTFYDYDNSIISQQYVEYNSSAIAPENPYRIGYTFIGWDMDYTLITRNLIVTADYTINQYTVIFLDHDNTVLAEKTVKYMDKVTPPDSPSYLGHIFIGWDETLSSVTSDMVVTAQYEKSIFNVIFLDWDGTVISKQQVYYEDEAYSPDEPYREGYDFIGWDNSFTNISADSTITALYSPKIFAVRFYDINSELIETIYAEYEASVEAPKAPEIENYYFSGWNESISCIIEEMSVYALYTEISAITLSIPDTDAMLDEMVRVPLKIDCPWSFTSLTVKLSWNTDVLRLMGTGSKLPYKIEYVQNGILLTFTPDSEYSGSGDLLTLDFFVYNIYDASLLDGLYIDIEVVDSDDDYGNNLLFDLVLGRVLPDDISHIKGDISLDGVIDTYDALLILQWCALASELNETQIYLCDLNNDGIISPADALCLIIMMASI